MLLVFYNTKIIFFQGKGKKKKKQEQPVPPCSRTECAPLGTLRGAPDPNRSQLSELKMK